MSRLFIGLILIIIAGAIILPFGGLPSSGAEKENPFLYLESALDVAGASIHEGEMHYWAALNDQEKSEPLNEKKLEEEALSIGLTLGFNSPEVTKKGQLKLPYHAEPELVELKQELPGGVRGQLLLQQMEKEGSPSRHLSISFTQEKKVDDLSDYAFRMPALSGSQVEKSSVSYCLEGHLEEKLSTEEMQDLAELIHQKLQGRVIHGFQEGPMVSVTGYSPLLGDYFKIDEEKYNLNVALRYDDYHEKTMIWVGTPLIARAY